jgi:hypothetical protein
MQQTSLGFGQSEDFCGETAGQVATQTPSRPSKLQLFGGVRAWEREPADVGDFAVNLLTSRKPSEVIGSATATTLDARMSRQRVWMSMWNRLFETDADPHVSGVYTLRHTPWHEPIEEHEPMEELSWACPAEKRVLTTWSFFTCPHIISPEKILIKMRAKTPGNGIAGRCGVF